MPTYDYKCNDCGHRFEEFQSIVADPVEKCPVCDSKVHRVINGGAGLIFKGTGFYITDYKNAKTGGNGNGKHSDKSEIKSESKTSDKTDSKPASSESKSSDKSKKN